MTTPERSVEELLPVMGKAYTDLSVQVAYKEGYNKALQAERQKREEMVEIFEDKLKAVYEANRKHIEDFEKDSTAYKYNPSEENLAKMKIHEGGNAGFRGGMIEGKMEAYEFILTQLKNK